MFVTLSDLLILSVGPEQFGLVYVNIFLGLTSQK